MKKKLGIRKFLIFKVTMTAAFVVLLVSIAACIIAVVNHNDQKHQTVMASLEARANAMETWFSEKTTLAEFMAMTAENRDFVSNREDILDFLHACTAMDSDIFDCYIGFSNKDYIFGSEYFSENYDPTSRVWYKMAAAADGPVVTDPYTDVQTSRMVITIADKFQKNGETVGVIAIDVFLDTLAGYVSELHVDESGYALLTTADGSIIVHENTDFQAQLDANENDVFTNLADTMKGYSVDMDTADLPFVTDYNSETARYGEVVLESTGWKLGYVLNNNEYNSVYVLIILMFVGLLIISSLYIMFIMYIQMRSAFSPLKDIANKAHDVASGVLDVSFDYSANDEIGEVCHTIENNNASIKNYIDDIDYRLEGIAHGKFDRESRTEYIGDYVKIKSSLDRIASDLSDVFNGIEQASNDVSVGANEVANGSTNLADTVSQQTALITEIVSGIGTVSKKIENNVTGTDNARNTARQTADVVNTSSSQMSRLLEAMDEISSSSEEIKKIISTIEDISFQTNILALNASIEAARAGEAGKGFAVVADEVRNLAGKSAEASEQTSELIERSVNAVMNGRQIADETSESLRKVVEQTEIIDKIIVSINEDSHEQQTLMGGINENVRLVSDYVTTAAANAQESAASAEELNSQADTLKNIIQGYRKN
ncbi:MAG: methyl-accepting chemotaxis protein [Oscillospiraceae bacterium]|nr:methyl-accepting chemotaxis protein [Oscillospiraceae bacterium]